MFPTHIINTGLHFWDIINPLSMIYDIISMQYVHINPKKCREHALPNSIILRSGRVMLHVTNTPRHDTERMCCAGERETTFVRNSGFAVRVMSTELWFCLISCTAFRNMWMHCMAFSVESNWPRTLQSHKPAKWNHTRNSAATHRELMNISEFVRSTSHNHPRTHRASRRINNNALYSGTHRYAISTRREIQSARDLNKLIVGKVT